MQCTTSQQRLELSERGFAMDDLDAVESTPTAPEIEHGGELAPTSELNEQAPPSETSAPDLLTSVLRQFSLNFLLNDLSGSQSFSRLVDRNGPIELIVPGREPRRRSTPIEQVHQSRVSVRRLRSTIRTFNGVLDPAWTEGLLVELAWYADVLGDLRDLDVLRGAIVRSIWLVEDERIQALVMGYLDRQIEEARERGARQKGTKRYGALVDEMIALSTSVRFLTDAHGPARRVLSGPLNSTWQHVQKARRCAAHDPTNENLHRLRIELKRLQCAFEVVGVLEGKPATRVARAAEAAQQKLGVVHDEAGAASWLEGLVLSEPRLKRPFRELLEFHHGARREARRGWKDELRQVDRGWIRWREEST